MEYLAGAILAIVIGFLARLTHFDKDKSFYPTVLIVIALLYVLFAKISNDTAALLQESFAALLFLVIAIIGFKYSVWLIVIGLLAHGIFNLIHERFIFNSGIPRMVAGVLFSHRRCIGSLAGHFNQDAF